ncbi:MAG: 4-hydroxy-tetrahydrodipicolinate synthase [Clostridia bacterium]|nr:4-hydroxy-tetrahydrodipicolinate synthase [Clostridia bacterium]
MNKPIFEGSAVAIVTPFNKEGGVNFKKLEQLVDFHLQNGTDAIVVCGSTGEASTMPDEEHIATVKCVVDAVNHKVPVIAGTGSNDTAHGIELTKKACAVGVDATLIVTPYYNKCTKEGLIKHYTAMASNCDAPVILYNVPSRTNVNITPEILYKLADIENIVAVKECNFGQVPEVVSMCGDRYALYSGEDGLVVPMLSLGAKGVISVVANVLPGHMSQMVHAYLNGDIEKARKMQIDIIPMVKAMFCEVNPIPVKEAVDYLGFKTGECRLPLCNMSEANRKFLIDTLAKYDMSHIDAFLKGAEL